MVSRFCVFLEFLVGGFNPSEKYWSKWEPSPNRGEKPPRFCFCAAPHFNGMPFEQFNWDTLKTEQQRLKEPWRTQTQVWSMQFSCLHESPNLLLQDRKLPKKRRMKTKSRHKNNPKFFYFTLDGQKKKMNHLGCWKKLHLLHLHAGVISMFSFKPSHRIHVWYIIYIYIHLHLS